MAFKSTVTHVDASNFEEVYPKFKNRLKECHFVAFDSEFSGLHDSSVAEQSLFDTPEERYKKVRQGRFKIVQFGVVLFKLHAARNDWYASCFSFTVFPPAFDSSKITETFSCQASCLLFLNMHNFDFNKWVSQGIPYLNKNKSIKLKNYLRSHRSILQIGSDMEKKVLQFSKTARIKSQDPKHLHDTEINSIVSEMSGFSKVIEDISKSKKPIIGHNVYTDLLLTYQEFVNDLPETYDEYKAGIQSTFPKVFDTKRLSFNIRDVLFGLDETQAYFDHSLLSDSTLLTIFFNSKMSDSEAPKVNYPDEYKSVLDQKKPTAETDALCHEAAFDALITGCLFIQLIYLLQRPTLQLRTLPCTFAEVMEACDPWRNHINATRCTVPYLNLGGKDPESHRPENIVIKGHKKKSNLQSSIDLLNRNLPKFGDYDLVFREGQIIIACGSKGCQRGVKRYLGDAGYILAAEKSSGGIVSRLFPNTTSTTLMTFGGICIVAASIGWWSGMAENVKISR